MCAPPENLFGRDRVLQSRDYRLSAPRYFSLPRRLSLVYPRRKPFVPPGTRHHAYRRPGRPGRRPAGRRPLRHQLPELARQHAERRRDVQPVGVSLCQGPQRRGQPHRLAHLGRLRLAGFAPQVDVLVHQPRARQQRDGLFDLADARARQRHRQRHLLHPGAARAHRRQGRRQRHHPGGNLGRVGVRSVQLRRHHLPRVREAPRGRQVPEQHWYDGHRRPGFGRSFPHQRDRGIDAWERSRTRPSRRRLDHHRRPCCRLCSGYGAVTITKKCGIMESKETVSIIYGYTARQS